MNYAHVQDLQHTPDENFAMRAKEIGLLCAGPSQRGCFLVCESDGKAWLFGSWTSRGAPHFGRTVVPSAWTELNVSVMNQAFGVKSA